MRINLKNQLLELTEKKTTVKESKVAMISCNNVVPIKKVAFHDDSFVKNIDFDTAQLSPANEDPDRDVYIVEVTRKTEQAKKKRTLLIS